ncbi:hypothetical protein Bca101_080647 [Brassica carinata]
MVPLGWVGGVVGLLLATAISLYANTLVAKLHEFGGKRHIRYRDLAGFIYGNNTKLALLAVYVLFRDDHTIKLPHCIAIAGLICAVFAIGIPHLSALGVWLAVSTILSLIYIVVAIVLSVRDGVKAPAREYEIKGSSLSKLFTITGAAANLVFAFNTGMLPEIQATVRQPVVKNMMKALYFQFTAGVLPMYAVTFIGYWAYGSSTSTYLLNSVNGPLWVKALANISAILQSVISLHIFASPTYEYMDTKFGIKGHPLALKNLMFRIMARGGYIAVSTLISALLPFLGDFMSLTGAVSTFPLTFILANHILMSVAAAVAAVRLIALDSKNFHVFADLQPRFNQESRPCLCSSLFFSLLHHQLLSWIPESLLLTAESAFSEISQDYFSDGSNDGKKMRLVIELLPVVLPELKDTIEGSSMDVVLDACCQNIASDDEIWNHVVELSVLLVTKLHPDNPRSLWYERIMNEMLGHLERQPKDKEWCNAWLSFVEHS